MIPAIARNGASFRGAGLYYLHDKAEEGGRKPSSSERVAWTATRNLANDDPQRALDEMWRTAEDAAHLKKLSGHDARGRKNDTPVKTMSLSWAPHQSPTREKMEAAGDSFLTAMGWQEHQALLVAHCDAPHPHLHIIVNRVHPETGLTLNDWQERKRAQRWALQYEREEGQVLCLARVDKYDDGRDPGSPSRRDLAPNGMPYPYAKLIHEHERAFDNALAEAAVLDRLEKDMLGERHREEREAFLASGKAQFREARQAAYREVRDEFKPLWREHFAEERAAQPDLARHTRRLHAQAVGLAREGDHEGAGQALAALDELRDGARGQFSAERAELREQQLQTTGERQDEACKELIELRAVAFQEIKDHQKEERAELRTLQALRDAGQPYDIGRLQELAGEPDAIAAEYDNLSPEKVLEAAHRNEGPGALLPDMLQQHESGSPLFNAILEGVSAEPGTRASFDGASHEPGPMRNPIDGIASAISLGISMLEGLTTPSSPLDRARAKVQAVRRQEEAAELTAELRAQKIKDDFTRHALTAVREAMAEQERGRKLDHEDRERGRSRFLER